VSRLVQEPEGQSVSDVLFKILSDAVVEALRGKVEFGRGLAKVARQPVWLANP
jgi:hypothetical protein